MDPNPKPASSGDENNNAVLEHRSFARIGFLGNPSDVYFGRTISFTIGNFWASAKLEPSDHLLIKPHPYHDLVRFDSLDNLVRSNEMLLKYWLALFLGFTWFDFVPVL